MPVARLGASRSGAKLLLVVAVAALCLAVVASPAAANQLCGGPTRSTSAAGRVATASSARRSLGVVGWLGARAGTALAEKGFLTGIEWIGEVAGHQSAADQVLQELGGVRAHLGQATAQMNRVEGQLAGISDQIGNLAFENEMANLCAIVRQQRTLLAQYYDPMFKAVYRLAELRATHPRRVNVRDSEGLTLPERVQDLIGEFLHRAQLREEEGDFETLRHALVPSISDRTSILSRYGRVLMSKRFLDREDSNNIRRLFRELSEVRAIATWMSCEFFSSRRSRRDLLDDRLEALVGDNQAEEENLPPMIPPGVVIDQGSAPRGSLVGRPMWFPPSPNDLGWLPVPMEGYDPATQSQFLIQDNGVEQRLQHLNNPPSTQLEVPGLGKGWKVPTRLQLEALLSNHCEVDPRDPEKLRDAVPCTSALSPATGGTVAGYLFNLHRSSIGNWRELFCTPSGPLPRCPPAEGPGQGTVRHLFVWTSDLHYERPICGGTSSGPETENLPYFRQRWVTYTGYRTTATSLVWHAFPQLTARPRPAPRTREAAFRVCDTLLANLFADAPSQSIQNKGVLLATRNVEPSDLNPHNRIDYMAQWHR